jgi:hypothetical protein
VQACQLTGQSRWRTTHGPESESDCFVIGLPNTFDAESMAKFLDAIQGGTGEMSSSSFQVGLSHLAVFKDSEGHANIPQSYVTADGYPLGVWLNKQRQAFKSDKLSADRVAALEDLGVVWDPVEECFRTGLRHLQAFRDEHGHVNVRNTNVTADEFHLGAWLFTQRTAFGKNKLPADRAAALESLGVVWGVKAGEAFQIGLRHLQAFKDQEGHSNAPSSHVTADGFMFGRWLTNQRRAVENNKLSADRVAALEALGVLW